MSSTLFVLQITCLLHYLSYRSNIICIICLADQISFTSFFLNKKWSVYCLSHFISFVIKIALSYASFVLYSICPITRNLSSMHYLFFTSSFSTRHLFQTSLIYTLLFYRSFVLHVIVQDITYSTRHWFTRYCSTCHLFYTSLFNTSFAQHVIWSTRHLFYPSFDQHVIVLQVICSTRHFSTRHLLYTSFDQHTICLTSNLSNT